MNHCFRGRQRRQRGVTAYAVILTVAVLAILSHNLVHQALVDYHQGALVRDTIALQQLTDSALAQALYYLNRNDRAAATATIRESFGVALIEISDEKQDLTLRIVAHVPSAKRPRMSSQTLFRLVRDAKGRWRVAAAENEPVPFGS